MGRSIGAARVVGETHNPKTCDSIPVAGHRQASTIRRYRVYGFPF